MMIYFIGLLSGFLNGLFASGAGQILIFYLVFIKKQDTHKMRAVSVVILSLASIVSILFYSNFVNFEIKKILEIIITSAIGGYIGAKLMKKINSNVLNLISGILIILLTGYKILFGGG